MVAGIAEWRLYDCEKRTRSIVLMRRGLLHPLTKKRDEREKTRFWPVFERWYTEKLKGRMTNKDFRIVQQIFITTKKKVWFPYIHTKRLLLWSGKVLQCYCAFYLFQSFNKKLLIDIILASSLGYFGLTIKFSGLKIQIMNEILLYWGRWHWKKGSMRWES